MPVLTLPQQSSTSLPTLRAKALVFEDPESRSVLSRIERIAPSEATVLITGETGSGKEIIARHIHHLSHRDSGPFVAVNCGALSENLVESELFGHEKGAFTGALQARAGWFEVANGGTLFLDEIGDLPLAAQVKLLRVLQEGEIVRVGSRRSVSVNVRLIAATNVDLQQAMVAGHFREDLYYRLNVAVVNLPPLRERPGDIEPLVLHFIEVYERRLKLSPTRLSDEAWRKINGYSWPGNIRELENSIHHALLVCRNGVVQPEDLRLSSHPPRPASTPPPSSRSDGSSTREAQDAPRPRGFDALDAVLEEIFESGADNIHERVEHAVLRTAFRHCERNQVHTARLLGISRNVVRARLIQYGEMSSQPRSPSASQPPAPPLEDVLEAREAEARPALLPNANQAISTLRVGYQTFGQLILAKALGSIDRELARHGTDVEWLEFPGGMQLIEALQAGYLDIGVVGECPPVFAQAAEVPIVYFACEAGAPEAEAIIVRRDSPVSNVAQLAGKRVALNRGANVHYLLIQALEDEGLNYRDVHPVFLAPPEAERAFRRGEVDAWAIWEPLLSSVLKRTGAKILRNGSGLTDNRVFYIARKELSETHPELLDAVARSVALASDYAKRNPTATAQLLTRHNDIDREALEQWVTNQPAVSRLDSAHVASQQAIAERFYRLNLVPKLVQVRDACWGGL